MGTDVRADTIRGLRHGLHGLLVAKTRIKNHISANFLTQCQYNIPNISANHFQAHHRPGPKAGQQYASAHGAVRATSGNAVSNETASGSDAVARRVVLCSVSFDGCDIEGRRTSTAWHACIVFGVCAIVWTPG